MAKEVIMPALGLAQDVGVLLQWLKAEGETISAGEPLMEIETDKATVEVEAPATGVLTQVTAGPGDEVPVGQVIAWILAPGEHTPEAPASASTAPETPPGSPPRILASPVAKRLAAENNIDLSQMKTSHERIQKEDVLAYLANQHKPDRPGRILASPKARRLASERHIDLTALNGSGPEGAILAADVVAAGAATLITTQTTEVAPPQPIVQPSPTAEPQVVSTSRMWQVMAQRLTESWHTIPHFYLTADANASNLHSWRRTAQQRLAEKLTFTDLLVKLVAAALKQHPRLNAKWENDNIVANDEINVGLAVAIEAGLLVPVIHQADQLGLQQIAVRRQTLVDQAKTGKVPLEDLQNGTFTISNLGMYGVDHFNAIVNPPQAAILALGRIADRVIALEGQPVVQPMMTLTLSCDHRIVDGARGAQFLQTLVRFIEDPLGVLD